MERNHEVIAIDFDGTLFETDYPTIVSPNLGVIDAAKWCKECGDKLILWTCREGPELEAAVEACRNYGIEFDAVNDNLPELKEKWGNNPRKIAADEYWDDKNSWPFIARDQFGNAWLYWEGTEAIKRCVRPVEYTNIH